MFGTPVTGEKECFVSKWRPYMVSSILFPVIPDYLYLRVNLEFLKKSLITGMWKYYKVRTML